MENPIREPYRDTPLESQSIQRSPSSEPTTTKPLPALPIASPAYTEEEPYQDEPSSISMASTASYNHQPIPHPPQYTQHHIEVSYQPYSDTPPTPNDDDVPLAHLILQPQIYSQHYSLEPPYPLEAPPSYSVAVRQSFRDTLIQYIPQGPSAVDTDEEAGVEIVRADDVRHSVEKVVAMFVVASLLLIISAVLGWLALGSGILG